jgi:hypothetical protein
LKDDSLLLEKSESFVRVCREPILRSWWSQIEQGIADLHIVGVRKSGPSLLLSKGYVILELLRRHCNNNIIIYDMLGQYGTLFLFLTDCQLRSPGNM